MFFKSLFFFSFYSGGNFVQPSGTILAILVEGHSRNIPVKLFQNPAKWNHFSNFGRGSLQEHSCKIISKSINGGDVSLK